MPKTIFKQRQGLHPPSRPCYHMTEVPDFGHVTTPEPSPFADEHSEMQLKAQNKPSKWYVCLTTGDLALLRALLLVELKLFLEERACGLSHLKASMKIYQRISDHTVV